MTPPARLFRFRNSAAPVGIVLLLFLAACASRGTPGERRDRTVIQHEEMRAATASDLHQVVEQLRPHWLRPRGIPSPYARSTGEDIVVYFGSVMQGGREVLRTVAPDGVTALRYLSGPEAQQRFGLGHRIGAIIVDFAPGS